MIDQLSEAALELLGSAAVATVATINPDGSPQLSAAWVGVDEDEIVFATLPDQRKLRNLRRDPRIAIMVQSDRINQWGLREYLVIEAGRASPKVARQQCSSAWPTPTWDPMSCSRRCPILRQAL